VPAPPQAEPGAIVAAGAVVVDPAGRVLLVRRGRPPSPGEWSLPGGRVEPGESPEDAVVREVREETALDVRVVAALGVVDVVRDGSRFAIHEFLVVPVVPGRAAAPLAGDDAADARWAARPELDGLGVRADAIAVVDRALALLTRDPAAR
jgi:8-oxo-dGTP diphosphatase